MKGHFLLTSAFLLFDLCNFCTKITVFYFYLRLMLENVESVNFFYLELTYKQKYYCFLFVFVGQLVKSAINIEMSLFLKNRFVARVDVKESNKHILCINL